jgi:hypothetical protein
MDFLAARDWIQGMNQADYLGHNNWQLPGTPTADSACSATGRFGNSFGFGCSLGAFSSLYQALGLAAPASVVPPAATSIGPFKNLQPELYWSGSISPFSPNGNGYLTYSFANGKQNSDVGVNITDPHNPLRVTSVSGEFLNVLPMYPGQLPGMPPPTGTGLQVSPDGQSVYDPILNVTWLTNANLAASNTFGIARCNNVGTKGLNGAPPCISSSGTMNWTTAQLFVQALNSSVYLGGRHWQLPPILDANCSLSACANANDPMAYLYYQWLGLSAGDTVQLFDAATGPFTDLQPYFYWSCVANSNQDPELSGCSDMSASPGLFYDFSFDSGFLNTDLFSTYDYVTAYYVREPSTLALLSTVVLGMIGVALHRMRGGVGRPFSGTFFDLKLDRLSRLRGIS